MYLGFDTSNYTTSVALFDGENVVQEKKLLFVKHNERGLRQSDAVFQHTQNLPALVEKISKSVSTIDAVAVSNKPRNVEGSYMPCFTVGESVATSFSSLSKILLYKTSHQVGHILASLYSSNKLDLINEKFIAFHVSGGTTEALLVTPHKDEIIKAELIAQSNDLKAGQLVDRTGVLLGLDFPCGAKLDEMASSSKENFKIKPSMSGVNCSLSGVENKVKNMIANNCEPNDIAKFAIQSIAVSIDKMTEQLISNYGNLPLVFAGGVMSNSYISSFISNKYGAYFAKPEFSCDNAVGIAIYAYLKQR